jgi:hypothetical protein
MVTVLTLNCPTLPDGHVLTAALVRMEDDRFGSMFLNGIQVCCASGSSWNVHPNTAPIEESFHRCMDCALLGNNDGDSKGNSEATATATAMATGMGMATVMATAMAVAAATAGPGRQ